MKIEIAHSQMCIPLEIGAEAWEFKMRKKGIPFTYLSVARDTKIQIALFSQGRNSLEQTNLYRKLAGMAPITEKENLLKVTWTLHSQHITDLFDGNINNDFSRAFDFAIGEGKDLTFSLKCNMNHNEIKDYQEASQLAVDCGLEAGFFWKNQDPGHVQLNKNLLLKLGCL